MSFNAGNKDRNGQQFRLLKQVYKLRDIGKVTDNMLPVQQDSDPRPTRAARIPAHVPLDILSRVTKEVPRTRRVDQGYVRDLHNRLEAGLRRDLEHMPGEIAEHSGDVIDAACVPVSVSLEPVSQITGGIAGDEAQGGGGGFEHGDVAG